MPPCENRRVQRPVGNRAIRPLAPPRTGGAQRIAAKPPWSRSMGSDHRNSRAPACRASAFNKPPAGRRYAPHARITGQWMRRPMFSDQAQGQASLSISNNVEAPLRRMRSKAPRPARASRRRSPPVNLEPLATASSPRRPVAGRQGPQKQHVQLAAITNWVSNLLQKRPIRHGTAPRHGPAFSSGSMKPMDISVTPWPWSGMIVLPSGTNRGALLDAHHPRLARARRCRASEQAHPLAHRAPAPRRGFEGHRRFCRRRPFARSDRD